MFRAFLVLLLAHALSSCSLEPPIIDANSIEVSGESCSANVFIHALATNIGTVGATIQRGKLETELRAVAVEVHNKFNGLVMSCTYRVDVLYHIGNSPPLFLDLEYSATTVSGTNQLVCVNRLSPSTNQIYPEDYRNFPIDNEQSLPLGPKFLAPCFNADGELVEYR